MRPDLAGVAASMGISPNSSTMSDAWLDMFISNLLSSQCVVLDPRKSCYLPITTFVGPNFDSSASHTCLATALSMQDTLQWCIVSL